MSQDLSPSARKIQQALAALGADLEVVELPASTRTVADAASAIGCTEAQIAKSIVFRTVESSRPVLVVASGPNRIDEKVIQEHVGEPVEMADAAFVREATGFAIGGVPPLGHPEPIETIVDQDLLILGEVWAAAGTPRSVFRTTGEMLAEMTAGAVIPVR